METELTTDPKLRYRCRHIFTDGHRCGSPALRRESFCYYHHTSRRPAPAPGKFRHLDATEPFTLPLIEDAASALLAASLILSRIASNDLDPFRAAPMISTLRTAVSLLRLQSHTTPSAQSQTAPTLPLDFVDDPILDQAHGPIAPIAELPQPETLPTLQVVGCPVLTPLGRDHETLGAQDNPVILSEALCPQENPVILSEPLGAKENSVILSEAFCPQENPVILSEEHRDESKDPETAHPAPIARTIPPPNPAADALYHAQQAL